MGNKIHYLADSCVLARLSVFLVPLKKRAIFIGRVASYIYLMGSNGGAGAVYKEAII